MNMLVLGLANSSTAIGDTPLRDSCVLVCLIAGIVLLLIGFYLLISSTHSESERYSSEAIRADE